MKLLLFSFLITFMTNIRGDISLYRKVNHKLYNVLDFIEQRYEEFNFDGLFGVTFAQTFLMKSLKHPLQSVDELNVNLLINKCINIHKRIYKCLPNNPEYMITFRNNLLDAGKWSNSLPDQFTYNKIKHMGYYTNWTADTIIKQKRATYKGVKSDVCLREILELSYPNEQCYISGLCEEMMLDNNRIDTGYLLTHRLLYLQIIKLQGCILPNKYLNIHKYITIFCSYVHKEAKTSEKLGFPHYDIFLEQVVLCGMEGNAEFLNAKWLNNIIQWQNPHGCYESVKQNITKRTSFAIDFGCSDHTTGLGAAALALNLRHLLYNINNPLPGK